MNWDFFIGFLCGWLLAGLYVWIVSVWRTHHSCPFKGFDDKE